MLYMGYHNVLEFCILAETLPAWTERNRKKIKQDSYLPKPFLKEWVLTGKTQAYEMTQLRIYANLYEIGSKTQRSWFEGPECGAENYKG